MLHFTGTSVDHCTRRYSFFNHVIESDVVLPELTELTGSDTQNLLPNLCFTLSDNQVEFIENREWLHHWTAPDQSVTLSFAKDSGALFLHFPGMGCFEICNNGRRVTCYSRASLALATIRHLLLDQVLPRLFAHFYSYTVFHASFLSDSGWGKSTIAVGFGAAGHTILTDDCLGMSIDNNHVIGIPAYYGIRLMPDSIDKLGHSFENTGEAFAEYTPKKRIALDKTAYRGPKVLPMQALFLLTSPEEGEECKTPEIRSLGGFHAMKELLKNSICLDAQDREWQKEHFKRLSALATSGRCPVEYWLNVF